jgi:glycosyltransferase involved in cell wall biosynthesis
VKIAIVAASPIPFSAGGAEKLWNRLHQEINDNTHHQAELIKLPSPERTFWDVVDSYEKFWRLDLSHFDLIISGKYPAWMVRHGNHVCYMLHRLRGFYDCFHFLKIPEVYETTDERLLKLRASLTTDPSCDAVNDVFACLRELRQAEDLPADAFRFPGSLIREIVRFFDNAALHPKAIRRYAAISANVANRVDYFPAGVAPRIIYPPSNLRGFRCGNFDYIMTASRLDGPKRIDLALEAMKLVQSDVELRICGEGPDEARLRELAGNDTRIRFLGYRCDADLIEDYANALAVIFTPFDEDYGFITVEAMMSGKLVITTTDAGGPNEFVTDHETGFSVAPDARELARRIEWISEHRDAAEEMGGRARNNVRTITWSNTVNRLLGPRVGPSRKLHRTKRSKLTLATTFPITPVRGGGQARILYLYKNLFPYFETEIISLTGEGMPFFDGEIAPGVREIRIPKSRAHALAESEISREVNWFPVTDVVFPDLASLTPAYADAIERSAGDADALVASHPYALSVIEQASSGPIWYDAHNVEYELKRSIIPKTLRGLQLIDTVREIESRACAKAELSMTCSEEDRDALVSLYDISADTIRVVPNGVDTRQIRFVSREESQEQRKEFGCAGVFTAIFLGSWHMPNIEAAERIIALAGECPDVAFMIVGSCGGAFSHAATPPNVVLAGVVDPHTKSCIFATADVALNPIEGGSGTNLKMLEYAAAGIPIISTAAGARGLSFDVESEIFVAKRDEFARCIDRVRNAPAAEISIRVRRARQRAEQEFDWRNIARKFLITIA